jgi:hypothetical protein
MLPDTPPSKALYRTMLATSDPVAKQRLQTELRGRVTRGALNVNIKTKVDRANIDKGGGPLPEIYSDALAALRGFALSTAGSGIVLSAGLNRRLFTYMEEFEDFYPDATGKVKKEIILKVSDYRSAVTQGKFFAKKGLWVSEYRIESGLNCGGHAFAGNGYLMGPVLEELRFKRHELATQLSEFCRNALKAKNKIIPKAFTPFRVTAQGGIGTAQEDAFLRRYYHLDSTGWGSPFLLVPEVTQVDPNLLSQLVNARENDVYLSDVSPLGVPFQTLRDSPSEIHKRELIKAGHPGSTCPLGHLVNNTEFTQQPICTASKQFQTLKISHLKKQNLPDDQYHDRYQRIIDKSCICSNLGDTVYELRGIKKKSGGNFPAVCPGPNIAHFNKVTTLPEMTNHIYGRSNLMTDTKRPHMFIKELQLNIDFLAKLLDEKKRGLGDTKNADLEEFHTNLSDGIAYYRSLTPVITEEPAEAKVRILAQLNACDQKLAAVINGSGLAI